MSKNSDTEKVIKVECSTNYEYPFVSACRHQETGQMRGLAMRVGILTIQMAAQENTYRCKQVENRMTVESIREPRKICLGTLRNHKGSLPGNRFDVLCHATPAANEHFAVVEVSSEDPSGSSPRVRFSLRLG